MELHSPSRLFGLSFFSGSWSEAAFCSEMVSNTVTFFIVENGTNDPANKLAMSNHEKNAYHIHMKNCPLIKPE